MAIYLDNNATTAPSPGVRAACAVALEELVANPSSQHAAGCATRRAVERARSIVSDFLGARSSSEVIFTSGATESAALAFHAALQDQGALVVTSAAEHAAILGCAQFHQRRGCRLELVPVDASGHLSLEGLKVALAARPRLVSLIAVNNETGVIFDLEEPARMCRKAEALLHIDASQAVGRIPVDVGRLGCDYLTLSGHKFHAPKGVGVLWVRSGAPRAALLPGRQEGGSRGGTENVVGIVGLGTAIAELTGWESEVVRIAAMRDRLETQLLVTVAGAQRNGDLRSRVCNTANISFPRRSAADLVERLSRRGVFVSAGAACSTGSEPSHVLLAMGLGRERANQSIRFSLSRYTTDAEVDAVPPILEDVYESTPSAFGTA